MRDKDCNMISTRNRKRKTKSLRGQGRNVPEVDVSTNRNQRRVSIYPLPIHP